MWKEWEMENLRIEDIRKHRKETGSEENRCYFYQYVVTSPPPPPRLNVNMSNGSSTNTQGTISLH